MDDLRDFWFDEATLLPTEPDDGEVKAFVVVRASSLAEAVEFLNDEQSA